MNRRKAIGAIGGAVLLAGCANLSPESDGDNEKETPKPPRVEYKGYHESSQGGITIEITEQNKKSCGPVFEAIVTQGGGSGYTTKAEVVLYLYSEGELVHRAPKDLGTIRGQDEYLIEYSLNSAMVCNKDPDTFKLAGHYLD